MDNIKRKSSFKIVEGKKKTYHWFTVNSSNGKVLVTSEMYKSKPSVEKGILALKVIMGAYE